LWRTASWCSWLWSLRLITVTYSAVQLRRRSSTPARSRLTRCGIHRSYALLGGVPVAVTAQQHDTSVREIEAHYAKYITDYSDALSRRALLNTAVLTMADDLVNTSCPRVHSRHPVSRKWARLKCIPPRRKGPQPWTPAAVQPRLDQRRRTWGCGISAALFGNRFGLTLTRPSGVSFGGNCSVTANGQRGGRLPLRLQLVKHGDRNPAVLAPFPNGERSA